MGNKIKTEKDKRVAKESAALLGSIIIAIALPFGVSALVGNWKDILGATHDAACPPGVVTMAIAVYSAGIILSLFFIYRAVRHAIALAVLLHVDWLNKWKKPQPSPVPQEPKSAIECILVKSFKKKDKAAELILKEMSDRYDRRSQAMMFCILSRNNWLKNDNVAEFERAVNEDAGEKILSAKRICEVRADAFALLNDDTLSEFDDLDDKDIKRRELREKYLKIETDLKKLA